MYSLQRITPAAPLPRFTCEDESFIIAREDGTVRAARHSYLLATRRYHIGPPEPVMALAGADVSYLALGESGRVYACVSSPLSQWDAVTVHYCHLPAPVAQVLVAEHRFYVRDEKGVIYSHPRYIAPMGVTPVRWQPAAGVRVLPPDWEYLPYGTDPQDPEHHPLPPVVDAVACPEGVVVRTKDGRAFSDMAVQPRGRDPPSLYPLATPGPVTALAAHDRGDRALSLMVRTAAGTTVPYRTIHASSFSVGDFDVTPNTRPCNPRTRIIAGQLYFRQYLLPLPDGVHVHEAVVHTPNMHRENEMVVLVRARGVATMGGADNYYILHYARRAIVDRYECRYASYA